MESIEISAKSVEDAVALALTQLGLDRSQVQIEVLSKGRAGILGFGSGEARVRVTPVVFATPEAIIQPVIEASPGLMAKEVVEKILSLMELPASVRLIEADGPGEESGTPTVDVQGQELGVLIGRKGETLFALQNLVNLILSRQLRTTARVVLDVESYKARRREALATMALRMADQVKSTGRSLVLEAMPAHERRAVHLALREHPDVTTRSVGEGEARKVVIFLKKGLLTSE